MTPDLLPLVDMFYEAALDPGLFDPALEKLAAHLHCDHAYLAINPGAAPAPALLARTGLSEADVARMISPEAFQMCAPYLLPYLATHTPGRALVQSHMFGEGEFERSAFFNEIVRPNNTFHATGLWHDRPDVSVRLIACRPKQTGDFSDAELRPLEQVFAHLKRAVTIHQRMRISESNAAGLAGVIDRMSEAALMLDAAGRVLIVNARASEILDQRAGLVLVADDLQAPSPALSVRLRDTIVAAMTTGTERRLALPRTGRLPLLLDIVPLWRIGLGETGVRAPRTAIFLREPDAPLSIDRAALIETFGLTRREGDIVCRLAEGLSVTEIAARLQLQPDTVRQNLKSAYGKTQVHGQAALVALVRGFAR